MFLHTAHDQNLDSGMEKKVDNLALTTFVFMYVSEKSNLEAEDLDMQVFEMAIVTYLYL